MAAKSKDQFVALLEFIEKLKRVDASFRLASIRRESIMVEVYAPGEHWEIEFMADGSLEIERFTSTGDIYDANALKDLWTLFQAPQALGRRGRLTRPTAKATPTWTLPDRGWGQSDVWLAGGGAGAAVDREDGAGDVPGALAGEEQNGGCDVGRLGWSAQRDAVDEGGEGLSVSAHGLGQLGEGEGGGNGVEPHAVGPQSRASERTKLVIAALVAL